MTKRNKGPETKAEKAKRLRGTPKDIQVITVGYNDANEPLVHGCVVRCTSRQKFKRAHLSKAKEYALGLCGSALLAFDVGEGRGEDLAGLVDWDKVPTLDISGKSTSLYYLIEVKVYTVDATLSDGQIRKEIGVDRGLSLKHDSESCDVEGLIVTHYLDLVKNKKEEVDG